MLYEGADRDDRRELLSALVDRVVDGTVCGRSECWVVIARGEDVFTDWLGLDPRARDAVPPRMCREILRGGELVLAPVDLSDAGDDFPDLPAEGL